MGQMQEMHFERGRIVSKHALFSWMEENEIIHKVASIFVSPSM